MKVAVSSAAFSAALAAADLTQLEWLDLAANELEADGVVFDAADFPRTDGEYLAQLRKAAVDLGLGVAALCAPAGAWADDAMLERALALGAPILMLRAPGESSDAGDRPAFVASVKARAKDAKRLGIVLAVRNVPGTLCPSLASLRALAVDVDSSWLRYALDPLATEAGDDPAKLLPNVVVACAAIGDAATFATEGDERASAIVASLAHLRCYAVLEGDATIGNPAFHDAVARFGALRAAHVRAT